MKTILTTILGLAASLTLAHGQLFFHANLDGAQDGGGLRQGTGSVNMTLTGTSLSFTGTYSGLTVPSTAGHIHGPGAPGVSVGVIYPLDTLGIISLGATSGTYSGSVTLAAIGAYTLPQQLTDLNNGLWYLNIHDNSFPLGEIRGQILPVPEPSTLALLGLGGIGVLLWRRRGK